MSMQKKPQMAEAVLFFNDSGVCKEMLYPAAGILEGKADAVLAASIFHFGEYTVPEAKAYLASRGIVVR